MDIPSSEIRSFILQTFSNEEFEILCYDYFRDVQRDFTSSMTLPTKIQCLIGYCDRHQMQNNLRVALQKEREELFLSRLNRLQIGAAKPVVGKRDSQRIFISHAHQDSQIAHRLARDLEVKGWSYWIAPESIKLGEKWAEAIQRGLDECGIFLSLVSGFAVQSSWVRKETYAAMELEHRGLARVIPLDLQECDIPILWGSYQRIHFRDSYDDGWKRLQKVLSESLTFTVAREPNFDSSIKNEPSKLYSQLVQQQGEIEQLKQDLERRHLLEDALKSRIAKLQEENVMLRYKLTNVLRTQSTDNSNLPNKPLQNLDDINHIFNEFLGGFSKTIPKASKTKQPNRSRGGDVSITLNLEKSDADLGIQKEILIKRESICSKCSDLLPVRCKNCNGTGQVRKVQQSILGSYVNSVTCPTCSGDGETINCSSCLGKRRLEVQERMLIPIPQKTQAGMTLQYPGYGNPGENGGDTGDLLVKIVIQTRWFDRLFPNG